MKRKIVDINTSSSSGSSSDSASPRSSTRASDQDTLDNNNNRLLEDESAESAETSIARHTATGRRGHFKSRLGCFNCKRRRVKCNELRPNCSPCRRLGLSCVYPTYAPTSTGVVRPNPSVLTLEDLRFYHQFLTTAFPTLPLRADAVWSQCAAMSHQYEALAHAVLGLGASHLTQHTNVDYTAQALHHRVAALKLVNDQLNEPPTKAADADALFAAVVCLANQTSLLPDGMTEYLTMTRGGSLIAVSILLQFETSIFNTFTTEGHVAAVNSIVVGDSSNEPADFTDANEFLASVVQLKPLCEKPCELDYHESLTRCIAALHESPFEAWKSFAHLYRTHSWYSNDEFHAFIHPENYTAQLLIIHMFLLEYVLGPHCISTSEKLKFPGRKNVIISWARNLVKQLPSMYKPYAKWVKSYSDTLESHDGRYLFSP